MTKNIVDYIFKTLGLKTVLIPYNGTSALPYLLQSNYSFFVATIAAQKFLLMCDQQKIPLTPLAIRKHCNLVCEHWNDPVVYAVKSMASYHRIRLIQHQTPFIIPDRQLYLPFLGMAFSEADKKSNREFSELGTPAQLLILCVLNKQIDAPLTLEGVSSRFDYSQMTVSRAFDELEYFSLARRVVQKGGKRKHLVFAAIGQAFWEQALPLLKTPLRRIVGLESLPNGLPVCIAGINALAQKTMLSEQPQAEYATSIKAFNALRNVEVLPKSSAPILLQLWIYSPALFGNDTVDPLSLYLSLRKDPDERVQIALDELVKGIKW